MFDSFFAVRLVILTAFFVFLKKIFIFRIVENERKTEKTRENESFRFLNRFDQKKFLKPPWQRDGGMV